MHAARDPWRLIGSAEHYQVHRGRRYPVEGRTQRQSTQRVSHDRVRFSGLGQQRQSASDPGTNAAEALEGGDVAESLDSVALRPEKSCQ
jgi:hypothetical protein